jgi:ABC-2 type transport system permease protein
MRPGRYARLLWTLMKVRLNKGMMYSFNFWMAFFTDLSLFILQIVLFSAIFLQVETLNGWNIYQMIVFIGTFTILDAIYMTTYFFGVLTIPDKIRTGALDTYIVRPVNTLFYVSLENIDLGSSILVIPGILMVAYGTGMLGVPVTVWRVLGYIFLLLIMVLLMFILMIIIRTLAFWLVRIDAFCEIENGLVDFSYRIPGVVFRGLWKLIFFIFLPYGLMATIPTQLLTDVLDGRYWIMTIGVFAAFWCLGIFLWKRGMRRYSSASS